MSKSSLVVSPTAITDWSFNSVIPYAKSMLKDNPKLFLAFNKKLKTDKAFANDADARLNWLYEHSPFYDQNYLKYPILMSYKEETAILNKKDKEI